MRFRWHDNRNTISSWSADPMSIIMSHRSRPRPCLRFFSRHRSRRRRPRRVPVVSRTIFYLPAWTAEKQGFFKQEGLDVKLEVYDGSDKIFHDLRAGSHQIGIASIESVIADPTRAASSRSWPASPSGRRISSSRSPRSRRWPISRARPSAWCRCTRAPRSSSPTSPRPAASSSTTSRWRRSVARPPASGCSRSARSTWACSPIR